MRGEQNRADARGDTQGDHPPHTRGAARGRRPAFRGPRIIPAGAGLPKQRRPYLTFGGDGACVLLSEEDAVAEQDESCSSVHLASDPFGLGVDAFGGAVAVGKRGRRVYGVAVPFQAPGVGVQMGQICRANLVDPVREPAGVSRLGCEALGEALDCGGQVGHLEAGGGEPCQ